MPISSDNVLQVVTGSLDSSGPATITFPAGTTQNSAILVCTFMGAHSDIAGLVFNNPTGGAGSFQEIGASRSGGSTRGNLRTFVQRKVAAAETTYSMTVSGGSGLGVWAAFEIEGTGVDIPENLGGNEWFKFCAASGAAGATATTVASDESGFVPDPANTTTDAYDALGVAVFGANNPAGTTVPVFSSFDLVGHPTELQEHTTVSIADANHAIAMTVCLVGLTDINRYKVSASVSPSSHMASDLVVLNADGSMYSAKYDAMCGFEIGTETGIANGSITTAGTAPLDYAANLTVQSTIKRTGTYAAKLAATAGLANAGWLNTGVLGVYNGATFHAAAYRLNFYFDTLPTTDCEIAYIKAGSIANGVRLFYRSASGKLALKIGSGSDVLSDAVISVDTWVGVDLRPVTHTTTFTCDWRVDYNSLDATAPVAQTQVTQTGMTVSGITDVGWGWNDNTTAEMYVDDVVVSRQWGSYPLGDLHIVGVKVDPAGTLTISGTTSNFKTFTANGTLAAWDATAARAAIDDIPPVVGASADGFVQATTAAGDYVEIPMDTFTAAPDNCVRAGRWYIPGWAASGNPATLRVLSNDGTVDVFDIAVADHGFDDASLRYLCSMHRRNVAGATVHYLLTQTLLDALKLRVGFSTDALPDVGILSVLFELAYEPAVTYGITDSEGTFTLYVRQDPVSAAPISYLATTPIGTRGATFTATVRGSEITPVYVDPNTAITVLSVGASSIDEVTATGYSPDPA